MADLPKPLVPPALGRAIAVPAFRIMLWFDGAGDHPGNLVAAQALFDSFVEGYGAQCVKMRHRGRRQKGKAAKFNPSSAAKRLEPGADFGAIHLNGDIDTDLRVEGLPHLRLDHYGTRMIAEIAVPVGEDNIALADRVTAALSDAALMGGMMGYGFYAPEALESLHNQLPMAYPRYRTASEVQLMMGLGTLIRSKAPLPVWQRNPDALGGLPDIGWRTIVGPPYRNRLGDLPAGLRVGEVGQNLMVQAGDAPTWGDFNRAEDISAFRAMADFLAPVRAEPALVHLFFGATSLRKVETVDAYIDRFRIETPA